MTKYVLVESFAEERPLEVDLVSSDFTVYIRRNIRRVPNQDCPGKHWQMEEATMSKEEYATLDEATHQDLVARLEVQDEINAEILLEQATIQEMQLQQDETLADILLNQMEV